jgi:hypothetical protein
MITRISIESIKFTLKKNNNKHHTFCRSEVVSTRVLLAFHFLF